MDKILEALKNLLPEDNFKEVSQAVSEMLGEATKELEREYDEKLEEAYRQLSEEKAKDEKTAEEGYQEAFGIIQELRNRLETQKEEYDAALAEGYEEAWALIEQEKKKNDNITAELYEQYDKRLEEMKLYIVEKVDAFLQYKGAEIYENARRDVLNDPRMAEHRVALEKIVDITSDYLSDEDFALATSSKLEEANKQIEALKAEKRINEGKVVRLSTENRNLTEQVKKADAILSEATKVTAKADRNERAEKSKNVSGRGRLVTDDKLIAEYNANDVDDDDDEDDDSENLSEHAQAMQDMRALAGLGNKRVK